MARKRKMSQVFNNNPQGSWLKRWSKTDDGIVYKQILTETKLKNGKTGHMCIIVCFPMCYSKI
jgi:hypothetical protein